MPYNSDEYFNSKEFKSVLKDYETSLRTEDFILFSSEDMADIAEYYYDKGQTDKAEEILDKAVTIYPGAAAPLLLKAKITLIDKKDIISAGRIAEQIDDKSDLDYYYLKAEIMINNGETNNADLYLEHCFDGIDDDDKDFFCIDATGIFLDYNKINIAEKWLCRVKDIGLMDYKEQYARLLFEKGFFEKSKKLYDELIDNDPFSGSYWNSLASSQLRCNDIEGSIKSSEYAIAINPDDATALLNIANGLYRLGNIEKALVYYEKFNKIHPEDISGEILLGSCYVLVEQYVAAIEHFKKAELLADDETSNLSEIYNEWAFALSQLKRYEEALNILDKTEQLDCDHNEILVLRAGIMLESGNKEAANKYLNAALINSEFNPNIILKVSIYLYEYGFMESSYKLLKTLIAQYKEMKKSYVYLAACCFDLKKYDEFLSYLKKAVKHTPEDVRSILGHMFPTNIQPCDYEKYIRNRIK